MELLIYGATEAAFLLASRLHQDHSVTLLAEKSYDDRFANLDVSLVTGSGSDIDLLQKIEAGKMDMFIACSELDEANIVACWTLKKLSPIKTICFLSKADLNHNFAPQKNRGSQTAGHNRDIDYDIDTVIWPERLLAYDIFRIISVPEALDVEFLAGGYAQMCEYRIKKDSPLAGKKVMECGFPKGVLIVGIVRDAELFIPTGGTVIEAEDKVFFIGRRSTLNKLTAAFFSSRNKVRMVAIIGGGSVGFMLAEMLEEIKIKAKLIEVSQERCEFLADTLKSTLVLQGDGTDLALLESEDIAGADACICITNNDEKNLLCSLLIKQLGAERIVTRAGTMQNFKLFEHVGIDVIVSPMASALTEVINRLQARDVNVVALLEGDKAELLRITLPENFQTITLHEITLPAQGVIGVVMRNGRAFIPDGGSELMAGDNLEIFTMKEDAEKMKNFFFE